MDSPDANRSAYLQTFTRKRSTSNLNDRDTRGLFPSNYPLTEEFLSDNPSRRPSGPPSPPRASRNASSGWSAHADWLTVLVLLAVVLALDHAPARNAFVNKAYLYKYYYPFKPSTIPAWMVPIYSIMVPLFVIITATVWKSNSSRLSPSPSTWTLPATLPPRTYIALVIKSVLTATLLAAAITNLVKLPVGRLRPDFLARCWPDDTDLWSSQTEHGGYPYCDGDAHLVKDGHKSFPSGHSSFSAAGLGYLSLWLLAVLRPFDLASRPSSWRLLASLLPALAAVGVGISRVVDYWHHWEDVVVGLALGFACAYMPFYQLHGPVAARPALTRAQSIVSDVDVGPVGETASLLDV